MRYGLISGARRMTALRTLQARTGEARFGTVLALCAVPRGGPTLMSPWSRRTRSGSGLSFYERARIVMRAVEAGVYDSEKKALQGLFATASFAKRSKIKSFIPIVAALDGVLRFPARISGTAGAAAVQGAGGARIRGPRPGCACRRCPRHGRGGDGGSA
jgi:ParB family transcriptional regulator, chromosome partitioning protein